MATFVLVHPAWFGGWCEKVGPPMRAAGHEVHTPTLTGLGERSHLASPDVGLGTHITDVVNLLEHEDLSGVTLVGNSSAGMVITGVVDRAADRVQHVVYLDAYVPQDGQCLLDLVPPARRVASGRTQRVGSPARQRVQSPQPATRQVTARSPGVAVVGVWPHRLDDTDRLVTDQDGTAPVERAVEVVQVAVAQTDGQHADKDLAAAWLVVLDVRDGQLRGHVQQHRGADRPPQVGVGASRRPAAQQDGAVIVLATFVGGWGHAEPLLPVAALARAAGRRVSFAGQAAVLPRLTDRGFPTFVVGPETLATERLALVPVDREHEQAVVRDHFVARYGGERSRELRELFLQERPDVVVCDEADVGAVVAAEVLGIPSVTVSVIAAGRLMGAAVVGDAWDELRARHGLGPDPGCERMGGTLALAPVPRSFRAPEVLCPRTLRWVRPAILDVAAGRAAPAAGRPFVYATLGTVFNVESGDLLERLVAALGLVDADALLTIGPHIAARELGPIPPNVHIEPYVPQREVLGHCQAVVCHGGSGTLVAALSLGVPVVMLPMGADQPDNADRCEDLGVGVVLDPLEADPPAIAEAIRGVLDDPRFAQAAARLAEEASAQPPLSEVPELLALLG